MTDEMCIPSIEALKQQAKRLRAGLADVGDFISHSESLELIARQFGQRDWNTLHAAVGNQPPKNPYFPGARVQGRYLGQAFSGEIVSAHALPHQHTRLAIQFDDPVDVVTFDSFSAYRSRVHATVNADGVSPAKTSNGEPQMIIEGG